MKKAFVTGVSGQDGSYLAELLLEKGYEVHGLVRRTSSFSRDRIDHIHEGPYGRDGQFVLHYGDMCDSMGLADILREVHPDEVYNLAAQSHVRVSFDLPEYTGESTGMGTLRLLEMLRRFDHNPRFYQASSSEMFGKVQEVPQTESTPFHPRSPYACAKVFAYWLTVNYREAYGLHTSNGILFNHESPRRGESFVTRKITIAVAHILAKKQTELSMGNLEARRDWGFAGDYVDAMWRILQQPKGDDYVIATGETHSIREFLDEAFGLVGLDWHDFVKLDPRFLRPSEVDLVMGDGAKAKKVLDWKPTVTFKQLVRIMLEADLKLVGFDPDKVIKR